MNSLKRITALLLLVAYAITGTSVLTATAAALVDLDGSHELRVQESDHSTQLVLHHRQGNVTAKVADHPNASLRVLVCFCHEDQNGDHHFTAAHVTDTACTEVHESMTQPSYSGAVNFEATQILRLTFIWPLSAHVRLLNDEQGKQKNFRRTASPTPDRLLI